MMKIFKLISSAEVVMLRFGIFVSMLLSLLTCSFGFTMDRSGIKVLTRWNASKPLLLSLLRLN